MPKIDPQIKDALKNLGFTDYFVSIYVTLLKHKELDARKLSELTKVPYSRVYEVLNEMIDKGVIIKIDGRPSTYVANTPREALTSLQARQNQSFEENANIIRPYLESLFGPEKTTVETPLSILYGEKAVIARLANLVKSTAQSLVIAISDLDTYFPAIRPELERLKVRNARVSVVVQSKEEGTSNYHQLAEIATVKTVPELTGTFAVADGMNVFFTGNNPKSNSESVGEVIALSCSHSSVGYVIQTLLAHLFGE
ncbi:MAG TPA: helix-turn-helix domain-containing protein [Candidatus Lokiarchaeia archaeon]|nr:helix-turn-helix domain-containing protein [Candidatus Lokiarchaeia archaeon]